MEKTPMEAWIAKKITGRADGTLTRNLVSRYQLQKLQETVGWVLEKSRFYRRHFGQVIAGAQDLNTLEDLERLPFTTPDDVRNSQFELLCVPQGEISRIVTLQSSGTTGIPKRIFFTEEDQELTVDFFQHGIAVMVKPGDRVLILLPGSTPGSVGDLLVKGLARMGAEGIVHGPAHNPAETLEAAILEQADALVGIPAQVLAMARWRDAQGKPLPLHLKGVLLSTDHVPAAIVRELEAAWGCAVYNHYGMTEMGLGGGMECQARMGYHLREADLYFEIIDPKSGKALPDGESGEIVFTTLTRRGMPLIRYRTGDISRFLPEVCSCGTVLKRLDIVKSRLPGQIALADGWTLTIAELDETLFSLTGLLDFQAVLSDRTGNSCLEIRAKWADGAVAVEHCARQIEACLQRIPAIAALQAAEKLAVMPAILTPEDWEREKARDVRGTAKRKICDCRRTTIAESAESAI